MKSRITFTLCALVIIAGLTVLLRQESSSGIAERPARDAHSPQIALTQTPRVPSAIPTPPSDAHQTQQMPDVPPPASKPLIVDLWQLDTDNPDTDWGGVPAKRMHTAAERLNQFQVGQTLRFNLPQRQATLEAKLESTQNDVANVKIWKGRILDGQPMDNLVVTQGKIQTHITLATHEGTYTAIIENATGDTVLIDEGDITVNQIPFEDGIPIAPIEQSPPPVNPAQ